MSDLEKRLRVELASRVAALPAWEVPGSELRRTVRRRRTRRLRAALVFAPMSLLAVSVGVWDIARDGVAAPQEPGVSPAPDPTAAPRSPQPTAPRSGIEVPDALAAAAHVSPFIESGFTLLVGVRLPRSGQVGLLMQGDSPSGGMMVASVSQNGGEMRAGVRARYPSEMSVVAQPMHDGKGTTFVVFAPDRRGDEVSVTFSSPAAPVPSVVTVPMRQGLGLVPVPSPDSVTHVTVRAGGTPVYDDVPARELLSRTVPRDLLRILVTSKNVSQPVQVRDNGTTACRLTAGGYWPQDAISVEWNPFDEACARVDGSLQLLLADDRNYSSVAGVAPAGTSRVLLHWTDGTVTVARLSPSSMRAFLDADYRHPAKALVRAEAFDSRGRRLGTAVP